MSQFASVDEMFAELRYIVGKQASSSNSDELNSTPRINTRLFKVVNREVADLTRNMSAVQLIKIDWFMLTVHLLIKDVRYGGEVNLFITIPDQYPAVKPICKWDLGTIADKIDSAGSSISAAVAAHLNQFSQKYSRKVGWLKRIDSHLKSKMVDGNILARRLYIRDSSCSAIVDFSSSNQDVDISMEIDGENDDDDANAKIPRIQFLGPDRECALLLSQIDRNKHMWVPLEIQDIVTTLEQILGAKFALVNDNETNANGDAGKLLTEMMDADASETNQCAICYAENDQKAALTACNVCQKQFHNACLREWFQTLPSCRVAFDRLFGQCPYCQSPLSLRLNKK